MAEFDFIFLVMPLEGDAIFYAALGEYFRRAGFNVGFITSSRVGDRIIREKGFEYYNIKDLIDYYNIKIDDISKDCNLLESKYELNSIRDLVFPEKVYWKEKDPELMLKAILYFYAIERFVTEHNIRCIVQNDGAEILRRVVNKVAEKKSIPHIYIGFAPFPDKIALRPDESFKWDDLALYNYHSLSEDEKNFIDDLIASFRKTKKSFSRLDERTTIFSVSPRIIIDDLYSYLFIEKRDYKMKEKYKNVFIRTIRKFLFKFIFKKPNLGEKYIYLPLHAPNDSQITVRAPQFYRQEYLVEMISRFLPQGYKLYVKPHPAAIYDYSLKMLRYCSKIENVVLLRPEVSSHDIIENSDTVIVVNSTVGFESLFYFKPVIVLGESFYKGYGVTIDVEYLYELRKAIKRALKNDVDTEKIKAFLFSAYKASWPGRFGDISPENLNILTKSIINKLEKIEKNR